MEQISTIGIDIAKTVFQVHGIDEKSWSATSAFDPQRTSAKVAV